MSLKIVQILLILFGFFFKKSQAHLAQDHLTFFRGYSLKETRRYVALVVVVAVRPRPVITVAQETQYVFRSLTNSAASIIVGSFQRSKRLSLSLKRLFQIPKRPFRIPKRLFGIPKRLRGTCFGAFRTCFEALRTVSEAFRTIWEAFRRGSDVF